jgi:hypothetical protein
LLKLIHHRRFRIRPPTGRRDLIQHVHQPQRQRRQIPVLACLDLAGQPLPQRLKGG